MTTGQINEAVRDSVLNRLSRAAKALTLTERNTNQRDVVATQERIRNLARVPQNRVQNNDQFEVLTFELAGEFYALETKYVQAIMAVPELSLVPGTPDYLLGVINLRGEVLAIFDLPRLFGLPKRETNDPSHLIVFGETSAEFWLYWRCGRASQAT
jgi:purine-binding chemotaxis protein CheW